MAESIVVEKIEQETRVLKPPPIEEYSYQPISFANEDEVDKFIEMIKEKDYLLIHYLAR